MEKIIIGQTLGIIAMALTFISYLTNSQKRLLVLQTISTLSICLSFLFLGATTGFSLNVVCIIRNVIYYFQKRTSRLYYPTTATLIIAMIILGIGSFQGPISLLMIVALSINTACLSLGKPQLLRKSILLTSTLVLIYDLLVLSIGGVGNELLAIIASLIGIFRYRGKTESSHAEE